MTFFMPSQDEPCWGHFLAKKITCKILHAGYYWPRLHSALIFKVTSSIWSMLLGAMNINAWAYLLKLMRCHCNHRYL
jgi:hypothetical protein